MQEAPESSRRSILIIRTERTFVLSEDARQKWEQRMLRYIETSFPSRYRDLEEAGARLLIHRAVKKGAQFGIDTERDVAGLLELMICFGEDFELSPDRAWANRMIANGQAPPELRVALMRGRMMARSEGRIVVPYKWPSAG